MFHTRFPPGVRARPAHREPGPCTAVPMQPLPPGGPRGIVPPHPASGNMTRPVSGAARSLERRRPARAAVAAARILGIPLLLALGMGGSQSALRAQEIPWDE